MNARSINILGDKSLYIEHNDGVVYISDYVEPTKEAFENQSFELQMFAPKIKPSIRREEVGQIL